MDETGDGLFRILSDEEMVVIGQQTIGNDAHRVALLIFSHQLKEIEIMHPLRKYIDAIYAAIENMIIVVFQVLHLSMNTLKRSRDPFKVP